ncbi:hypothetical protein MNEG_6046 [Monoraphidium neglectum]|uniref:Protein Mpv17 n=1 Tax=Monoraphidium neglectum TaxID=145388 RepID=A0A0D2L411_9CHLO|nr:hypothetical protein MNEG_6046 [Monoraphidium neglectum]KIZ01914.1 hypothetical protein MNEG_6046 [Monoraphidium neglectum]|eukprot:XP_013900933.1 hypothetical protein MNEG_6046 [Monoraphidium neglectum]
MSTGLVTTVIKTSAADLFAQTVMEGTEFKDVDWKRHAVFCSFGFFYLGGFQYYLYNHLFVKWCHGITLRVGHYGSAPIKTFIDQAIHHPFCYFPCLYLTKGAFEGRPIQSTYNTYKVELWENCKALWTIWVPAQLINFAFVPRHLRIPYAPVAAAEAATVLESRPQAQQQTQAQAQQQLRAGGSATSSGGSVGDDGGRGGSGGGMVVASKGTVRGPASAGLGLKALVASPEVQT